MRALLFHISIVSLACLAGCAVDTEFPADARLTCDAAGQCPARFVCDIKNGSCVDPAVMICTAHGGCPAGYECDQVRGLCVDPSEMTCASSADCVAGTGCDPTTGLCVAPNEMSCTARGQCMTDYVCDLHVSSCVRPGELTCVVPSDCLAGYQCSASGICSMDCAARGDCPSGFECDLTVLECVGPGAMSCTSNAECFAYYFCDLSNQICQLTDLDQTKIDVCTAFDSRRAECITEIKATLNAIGDAFELPLSDFMNTCVYGWFGALPADEKDAMDGYAGMIPGFDCTEFAGSLCNVFAGQPGTNCP